MTTVPGPSNAPGPSELSPELQDAFSARTDADGFLPFDRFMDVALYGEPVGYYRRSRSPFGPTGDFYTAPRVHPLFARALAARVAEVRSILPRRGPFHVVDLGAGDGTLLAGLVVALGREAVLDDVRAVAVDRASSRREAAREAVARAAASVGVSASAAGSLAELGPISGVVVANELFDAQPVRQLRWDGSAWHELGLRLKDGQLFPAEAPVHVPVPPPSLPELGVGAAGTVVEVSPSSQALVREVADHLVQGSLVVVDFGAEEGELLSAHPGGTVAAVRGHRALSSAVSAPGESDLSAFVNFTRLRDSAKRAGLLEVGYRSQAEALGDWGFAVELERALAETHGAEEEVRLRLAAKNLLFGFGSFRALELAARGSTEERLGQLRAVGRPGPPGAARRPSPRPAAGPSRPAT